MGNAGLDDTQARIRTAGRNTNNLRYADDTNHMVENEEEQKTGSKSGKEYVKAVYCHPACLIYMQNTSFKMPDCMKHKLEPRLLGKISITLDMQMTPPLWQKAKN